MQVIQHFYKKRYQLKNKFSCSLDDKMSREVDDIHEFFQKQEKKNQVKQKLFPSRRILNFDTVAIHNFVLKKKSEIEFNEMLAGFDKENKRYLS